MRIKPRPSRAFTLLEVIIAMAIFFVAMFSVMQLMSQGLGMARSLQQDMPSPGMVAAELSQMAATNRLDDKIDASPAAVGKELFLRGHQSLYCIAEK